MRNRKLPRAAVAAESRWFRSGYRGWAQGYRHVVPGLASPEPAPIFAAWRANNEHGADILYGYRKETIELLFQRIMQALGLKQCQGKGEGRNGAFVLADVWLYQLCYLTNYREGKPLSCIKDHLDKARWRISTG